jgi:hypothetical protein
MSERARTRALLLCVALLAVAAAVFAAKAFAFTETYCSSCTLGDVPAVSSFQHFTSNHSSTQQAKKQQIYYYNPGDTLTSCSLSSGSTQVFGLNKTCTVFDFHMTARCHLLNDGTVTATCWADYDGQ